MKHRNAIEWMYDKVAHEQDIKKLRRYALSLVIIVNDSDAIQDVFQSEMDEDGYFEEDQRLEDNMTYMDEISRDVVKRHGR